MKMKELTKEQKLISIFLQVPALIHEYAYITEASFNSSLERRIYKVISEKVEKNEFISFSNVVYSFKDEKGIEQYIHNLEKMKQDTRNAKSICESVHDDDFDMRMATLMNQIAEAKANVNASREEKEALLDNIYSKFTENASSAKSEVKTFKDGLKAYSDKLKMGESGAITPWPLLSKLCDGINKAGEYNIFAGLPGSGKTVFLSNLIVENAKNDKKVLFVSAEMTIDSIVERIMPSILRIPSSEFKGNYEYLRECIANNADARFIMKKIEENVFFIDDNNYVENIRNVARKMKNKGGLDMICCDYVQILNTYEKTGDEVNRIGYISKHLKETAKNLKVTVNALAQLNRETNGRPKMRNLKQSSQLEQDAGIIMMIHREDYKNENEVDERIKGYAEFIIEKNRFGSVGDNVVVQFEKELSNFKHVDMATCEKIKGFLQEIEEAKKNKKAKY